MAVLMSEYLIFGKLPLAHAAASGPPEQSLPPFDTESELWSSRALDPWTVGPTISVSNAHSSCSSQLDKLGHIRRCVGA